MFFIVMYGEIIAKIKLKKPLEKLDNEYVQSFIEGFFKRNSKIKKKFDENKFKKKDMELVVKNVRNELNKNYGQFWLNDELILSSHKSTKERINFYHKLYNQLFSIIKENPKTVLDLGAGLNPLTYNYIPGKINIYFYSVELTKNDCEQIRKIFAKDQIHGEVIQADLRFYNKFPKVDLCLMLKLLDSIEEKGHKLAEHLVTHINAKFIVVSFATAGIKGEKMNYPKRGWFERMLVRLNLKFDKFEQPNEIFYVVKK